MAKVSNTIWETCKTYLFTQGKFLAILWVLIAICMVYYFMDALERSKNTQPSANDCADRHFAGFHSGHPRLVWRGVVRHPHQHRLQFPHRLLRAQGQPARHPRHPLALRHERRPPAGGRGTVLHDLHPGVPPARTRRPVFHRVCHRRIPRRVACSASAAASSPKSPTSAPTS